MIAKIVVLYLTVFDCSSGAVLYESVRQMPDFSVSGDRVEDCRKAGVDQAKALTQRFRQKFPDASSNVVCRWERSRSQRA
jgi:hypothetical protein